MEKEWLVTLATIDPEEVEYTDFVSEGTKLAQQLRNEVFFIFFGGIPGIRYFF